MKAGPWCLSVLAVAAAWSQNESQVTRQGRSWVQTVSGSASVEKSGKLRVAARGEISLRGEERSDVAYALTKRVRADSEQTARRMLGQFVLETVRRGIQTEFRLRLPPQDAEAQLRLRVPSGLREVVLVSRGGGLEAENLRGALQADTGGGHIRLDAIRGAVTVRTGGGNVRLGKIGGPVRCLVGGGSVTAEWLEQDADLATAGGEIVVRRAEARLHLTTGGGNIRVERARSVTAATGGGLIDVLEAEGPVVAEAAAGAVKVRAARGLRVRSGAGPIQLEDVSGGLRATTGRGDIVAALAPVRALEESWLSTDAGDITVFIPSNLAVTIQALNSQERLGRILSDFPEIQPRREGSALQARGSLNGGGPLLRLAASGGTIYLKRSEGSGVSRPR